ncbi:MAG: GNAT family N-acetyltransferase [Chloroflexi bacterium]|nr:GNAT family N-acetyltransferase [Chloroflexota bacterium]
MKTLLALHSPDPAVMVRPVRLTDAEPLHARCWPSRPFAAVYNLLSRTIRNAADGRGLGLVVLDDEGEVQGYGQTALWPTCAEISDLVVTEAYRGRGFGTALIQHLAREAARLQAPAIEIGAALSNPRALALYRRLGFEDSHTLMLNVGQGKEAVLFLRLELRGRRLE